MTPPQVPIVIDSRLRLAFADLPEGVVPDLQHLCEYANPARHKLERMVRGARGAKRHALEHSLAKEPAHIVTWRVDSAGLSLPRGALAGVRDVLRAWGLGWRYDDRRSIGSAALVRSRKRWDFTHRPDPRAEDGGALRWYQDAAVEAAVRKQNCLIRAPTGSGKTSTLIGLIAQLSVPTLIVVDSAELARQWRGRLIAELGLEPSELGQLGGGEKRVRGITIGMRQTLLGKGLAESLRDAFGLVVVDEVHRTAARTFTEVVDNFSSRYRVGASADETRADGKEFLVYDVFGEVAHEVTRDELIDDGAVLDVEVRVIPTEFRADWYVEQRDKTGSPDFNRLLDELTVDAARNLILETVAFEEVSAGEQVLLMSQRVEHAERLVRTLRAGGVRAGLALGGADRAAERVETIEGLKRGDVEAAAGTIQAIGTGVDIPSVSRGVLATPVGNNRQLFGQIRGRICRPAEGKTAAIYVLWDQHVSAGAPLKRMLEWNRVVVVRASDGSWVDGRAFFKQWKEAQNA